LGRGLSDLQKKILVLALGNVSEERRKDNYPSRPDLYAREVMVSVYGLDAEFYSLSEDDDDLRTDKPVRERRGWVFERERFDIFGQSFYGNEDRVNIQSYNSALVSTIRAFARLESRELVKRQKRTVHAGAGIYLTPAGYQLAKSLKSESNG
jgi:hypothetical protein